MCNAKLECKQTEFVKAARIESVQYQNYIEFLFRRFKDEHERVEKLKREIKELRDRVFVLESACMDHSDEMCYAINYKPERLKNG